MIRSTAAPGIGPMLVNAARPTRHPGAEPAPDLIRGRDPVHPETPPPNTPPPPALSPALAANLTAVGPSPPSQKCPNLTRLPSLIQAPRHRHCRENCRHGNSGCALPVSSRRWPQHLKQQTTVARRDVPGPDLSGCSNVHCRSWTYSITSSARASIEGGTVRPRAFAVLRLINSSNLVGCCTGRSCGLAPFKILSTYSAAR